MDLTKFKDAEAKYRELKQKLDSGEIDASELKDRLKETMIQDDDGHYWMIGGKSGKWYMYDGSEWSEAEPYQEEAVETRQFFSDSEESSETAAEPGREEPVEDETIEKPVAPESRRDIFPREDEEKPTPETTDSLPDGEETLQLEEKSVLEEEIIQPRDEPTQKVCKFCKSRIAPHAPFCQFCGGNQKETKQPPASRPVAGEGELLIKSIKMVPMIFFLGGLGLIVGVLFGATIGIFDILGDFIYQFPIMLQETRGKIQGGLIFAAMGGITGFIVFSLISLVITSVYNALSFFFGGIRLRIKS